MRLANYFQDVLHGAFNEPPHWLSKILSLCPLVQGENTVVDQKKLLRLTGVNDGFSSKLTSFGMLGTLAGFELWTYTMQAFQLSP